MMYNGFSPCWSSFGYGAGYGLIGPLINIALIVGVILLVVWTVKKLAPAIDQQTPATGVAGRGQVLSAREVLDIRYARGELSQEEYQQMKAELSG